MHISGTSPEPPAIEQQRPAALGRPHEVAADRPAQLELVAAAATSSTSQGETSPSLEPLDGDLERRRRSGAEAIE